MANTYTQLYIQFVFVVKGRQNFIKESFRDELEKVICGIITKQKCKTYAIYCNPDHTHVFISLHPNISPSKLMELVKSGASKWINDKKLIAHNFSWQDGFGAFTYAKSQVDVVVKYVLNQPNHHKKKTFREEYLELLEKFEVEYNPNFLFEWYD